MVKFDVHIREPYNKAGRDFNWTGDPRGLGIRQDLLEDDGILTVLVGNRPFIYTIAKSYARELTMKYKSMMPAPDDKYVTLCVIPWKEFTQGEYYNGDCGIYNCIECERKYRV